MKRFLTFISEKKRFLLVLALLGLFMIIGHFFGIRRLINADLIKQILLFNWYISLPLFILLCCFANLTNSPTTIIMTLLVYVTGRTAAIPLIFLGSVTACVFTFFTVSSICNIPLLSIKKCAFNIKIVGFNVANNLQLLVQIW